MTYIEELTNKRIFAMTEDDKKMLYICTFWRWNLPLQSHYP
jgi:hypothetical protein